MIQHKTTIEQFLTNFPSADSLVNFCVPNSWGYILQHTEDCICRSCITLAQTDSVYNRKGLAKEIVKCQLAGVHAMSSSREQLNPQACTLAAEVFISKYGHQCSLYIMLLYFASYMTEFKTSYAAFDLQDIILQFHKKFLPWLRCKLGAIQTDGQEQERERSVTLEQMLRIWVREGRTDEDFRQGGLYGIGRITNEMIRKARREVADGIF